VNKITGVTKCWNDIPVSGFLQKDYKEHLNEINFESTTNLMEKKFDTIKRGIERIVTIVNSLKRFSRVDMPLIGKLNINQSVEDTVEILSSADRGRIEVLKERQEIPYFECFPNEINQCLLHTIKNAMDAIGNNGRIKIITSCNEEEDQIIVQIIDNGE